MHRAVQATGRVQCDGGPHDAPGDNGSDIDKLVTAGVVGGFPDGTFGPRQPVTRGQMARFIGNKIEVLAEAGVW